MTELDPPVAESPWNARDLGVVCFVTLGVWITLNGLWLTGFVVRSSADLGDAIGAFAWASAAVYLTVGIALFLGGRRLAHAMLPPGHSSAPPQLVPLLSAAIALLGLGFAFREVDTLIRIVLPFLVYEQNETVPWRGPVIDLVTAALGVLVFARASVLARAWERWSTPK